MTYKKKEVKWSYLLEFLEVISVVLCAAMHVLWLIVMTNMMKQQILNFLVMYFRNKR